MKFLAIEHECENTGTHPGLNLYTEEAKQVYQLYLSGKLRDIYFNEHKNAVLVIECDSVKEAEGIIDSLPLVKNGYIRFELMQLLPYSGYERLFCNVPINH